MPDLADDLLALPPRARNAVLAALSASERRAVEALLDASPSPEEKAAIVSPELAAHIAAARRGEGMTAAARQALVRAADAVLGTPPAAAASADPAGRSLVGAMGGMLAGRRRP